MLQLVDYTGKINSHKEYLNVLKCLNRKCKYIEYAVVFDDNSEFIEKFENFILTKSSKNRWWGTRSSKSVNIYKLKSSFLIFEYLSNFDTFCKYTVSNNGDFVEITDFGVNDIAFFDDNEIPLLFTTTHEGYVTIREDLF